MMDKWSIALKIVKSIFTMPPKGGTAEPRIKFKSIRVNGYKYEALNTVTYHSDRYNRNITVKRGMLSDGATGALDITSDAWWFHDQLCNTGCWDDGYKVSNWDASTVLGDILWKEGHRLRSIYWWFATFFGGGGEAKKNGMVWVS